MEKDGLDTTRRVMLVTLGLLMVAVAALFVWSLSRSPWDTTAFVCSWLLVGCVWDFVEWRLARKDPEPPVAKWMHSPVYLIVSGIGACAFSYLLIQSPPTSHLSLVAGILVGLCFTGVRAYGFYLQRKGLRSEQTPDSIPPAVTK